MEERLFAYYNGTLDDLSAREVQAWTEASEENRRMARRVYSLLLATDMRRTGKAIHTEEALARTKARMGTRRKRIDWWTWMQRVAVILILPMAAFLFWQQSLLQDKEQTATLVEIRTVPGMTARLTLPDSTRVCLNSSSALSYPSHFGTEGRDVHLSGDAYFEVTKDPARRFVVRTPQGSAVEVYGTSFNVDAYPDAPRITTTLTEGQVGFRYHHGTDTRLTTLQPGEKLIYDVAAQDVSLHQTDGISELCWKDGLIIFDNTPLRDALHMLGKRFNVEFVVKDPKLEKDCFTGTFGNQGLRKILQYFEISSHVHWRYADEPSPGQGKIKIEIY